MSTRSGRVRLSVVETSPPKSRKSVVSPRRSPARTRKSSPKSRSATRKSPSRKSPSRKSPTRKSTSKNTSSKSPTRSVKELEPKPNSPSKRPAIKTDIQEKFKNISSNLNTYRSRRSRRIEYTIQDLQSDLSKNELILDDKFNLGLEPYLNSFTSYDVKNRQPVEEFLSQRSNKLKELVENAPDIRRSIRYFLNDFFVGREIHPSLKNLNVKLWISRIANINALILSVLIFKHSFQLQTIDVQMLSLDNYKEFISKMHIKQTALLYSAMQIIYILNFVLKEHKITTTFFWQYEGLGYLQLVSSALYPFYFTSIAKYVVDVDLNMSTNALIAALTLFLVGFITMLISNNVKHQFRKNPFHPSVTYLESMPTFHGNKLLVSNLWGIMRHPNYAGDILIHIALALPGILTQNPVAVLPASLTVLVLLHRAWRDHDRCSRRYGAAWQRYCKRVPSLIIPKIL